MKQKDDTKPSDDLLFGAQAIAAYTGLKFRQVYYQQEALGIRRLGGMLIGSKKNSQKDSPDARQHEKTPG